MKTAVDLAALTRQKTWDKDVVLWVGAEHALLHTLGQTAYAVLDLLDLFDEDCLPMDHEETQAHLRRSLRHRLELSQGAATDIKEYYDYCRKEYRFIRQSNISLDSFTAIFPFQPRCFDVM